MTKTERRILASTVQGEPSERSKKVEQFRNLAPNWDSYGCEAMNQRSVDAALSLEPHLPVKFAFVIPLSDGGIQFSSEGEDITIDVYASTVGEQSAAPQVQETPAVSQQAKPESLRPEPAAAAPSAVEEVNALPVFDVNLYAIAIRHAEKLDRLRTRLNKAEGLYHELLYAVGNKYPGETRHQTALRYIVNAERGNNNAAQVERKVPQ